MPTKDQLIQQMQAHNIPIPRQGSGRRQQVLVRDLQDQIRTHVALRPKRCLSRRQMFQNVYTRDELIELVKVRFPRITSSELRKLTIPHLCSMLNIDGAPAPAHGAAPAPAPAPDHGAAPAPANNIVYENNMAVINNHIALGHVRANAHCINNCNPALKDHQKVVVRFINDPSKRSLLMYHTVGSGKTLAAVASAECFLRAFPTQQVIVVTPASLVQNFINTLKRAYGIDIHDAHSHYSVMSYDAFASESDVRALCRDNMLIIDEAHNMRTSIVYGNAILQDDEVPVDSIDIKSGRRVFQALRCAKHARKVILMSGTPIINQPADLMNIILMLNGVYDPMFYKKRGLSYEDSPASAVLRTRINDRVVKLTPNGKFKLEDVEKYFRDSDEFVNFLIRNKVSYYSPSAAVVARDYPRTQMYDIMIPMTGTFGRKYAARERLHASSDDPNFHGTTHSFYSVIRQSANMIGGTISPKLKWLQSFLEHVRDDEEMELEDEFGNTIILHSSNPTPRIVLYSSFVGAGITPIIDIIEDTQMEYAIIDGATPANRRQAIVDSYNNGTKQILLITRAGSEGLDLKQTAYVVLMEPTWNEASVEQIVARGVRYKSHEDLPRANRVVNVLKLYSIKNWECEYLGIDPVEEPAFVVSDHDTMRKLNDPDSVVNLYRVLGANYSPRVDPHQGPRPDMELMISVKDIVRKYREEFYWSIDLYLRVVTLTKNRMAEMIKDALQRVSI